MCKAIRDLMRDSRAEGRAEGHINGLKEGRLNGLEEGIKRLATLNNILISSGRMDDLIRINQDTEYRNRLFDELLPNI